MKEGKRERGTRGKKPKIQERTEPGIKANTCSTNHENTFPDTMGPIWTHGPNLGPQENTPQGQNKEMFQSSTPEGICLAQDRNLGPQVNILARGPLGVKNGSRQTYFYDEIILWWVGRGIPPAQMNSMVPRTHLSGLLCPKQRSSRERRAKGSCCVGLPLGPSCPSRGKPSYRKPSFSDT